MHVEITQKEKKARCGCMLNSCRLLHHHMEQKCEQDTNT